MVVVFVFGVLSAGGLENVWNISVKGERLELDFNWDPTKRDSFWSVIIGGTCNSIIFYMLNQSSMQKFLALPTLADTKKAIALYGLGFMILVSFTIFTGSIMYANYWNCDPLLSNQVQQPDQLVVHFLMNIAGHIPLIPGIFIAGIFSASLSSLSASLNTISGTVYEDFVLPFLPKDITEKKASNILKLLVLTSGLVCIALIFVYEQMGSVFPIIVTLHGVVHGPLLALFTLGVLCPLVNAKGALYGGLRGLLFAAWIAIGNLYFRSRGMIKSYSKPVSTEGCNFTFEAILTSVPDGEVFVLYRLSMWYFSLVGAVSASVIAIIVSLLTKCKDDAPIELRLLCPIVHRFVKSEIQENQ